MFRCLSPTDKESNVRRELRLVKAQLAEAKITIADLKQGSGCGDRIGTSVAPTKHSVAVQAKPPVECESRIPRPEETTAPGKLSAAGMATARRLNASQVSTSDVSLGSPAAPAGSTAPVTSAPSARSMARSRIPASPSPDAAAMRRSTSARQPASTLAAATEDAACGPSSNTSSEAGACAEAGALAEASSQARADLLANQLKVAEAFRQSLETELRDLRFKNAGLQTQVLTLQTKLERAVESQVDELDRMQKLRKAAGGTPDSRGYEEVLAQMAVLERKLEVAEAAKTVAEQQAKAATERYCQTQEAFSATQAEASSLRAELGAAQARVLELTAEGARLKQQLVRMGRVQARADEMASALAAAKSAAAAAEAQHEDRLSKLRDELATQKAISESTCEELLALSASHGQLKQAYIKMEAETKQHDQLVHIVQQELAEMSYWAAAGRVALGMCDPEEAPLVSGAVLVTPTHSGPVNLAPSSSQPTPAAAAAPAVHAAAATQEEGPQADQHTQQGTEDTSSGSNRRNSRLVEDTTAVCIAAAAAAGAAAAVAASPNSPRPAPPPALNVAEPGSASGSRVGTPRRMQCRPAAAELLACATQAAAPAAAAAKEASLTAAGDSAVADVVEAAVLAAAVAAARVTDEKMEQDTAIVDAAIAGGSIPEGQGLEQTQEKGGRQQEEGATAATGAEAAADSPTATSAAGTPITSEGGGSGYVW